MVNNITYTTSIIPNIQGKVQPISPIYKTGDRNAEPHFQNQTKRQASQNLPKDIGSHIDILA